MVNAACAWIALEPSSSSSNPAFPGCTLELNGSPALFSAISEHDWILVVTPDGEFARTGQVLRLRIDNDKATIYFDRLLAASNRVTVGAAELTLPEGAVSRLQWDVFVRAVEMLAGKTVDDALLIENQAYIRELLQLAVVDDLLGPANGSLEQIIDMNVRDRYLVGRLSPMKSSFSVEGTWATETEEEEPGELDVHKGWHDPGAEFDNETGRVDAEVEAPDEIHTASNQSLVPSSFGMTICVDGEVDIIEVEARWGRYRRDYDIEVYKTKRIPTRKRNNRVAERRYGSVSPAEAPSVSICVKVQSSIGRQTPTTRKFASRAPCAVITSTGIVWLRYFSSTHRKSRAKTRI